MLKRPWQRSKKPSLLPFLWDGYSFPLLSLHSMLRISLLLSRGSLTDLSKPSEPFPPPLLSSKLWHFCKVEVLKLERGRVAEGCRAVAETEVKGSI